MMAKFAKAIAANIREIAVNSAQIVLIDQIRGDNAQDRAVMVRAVEKAEANIAALLQQPGAK